MARTFAFNGSLKSISTSASSTLIWTSAEIESADVTEYNIVFGGAAAGVNLSAITRQRVKANGAPIVDCTPAQLRALQQRMNPNNLAPAATATGYNIPLNAFDQRDDRASDTLRFPRGALAQVELDYTSGATLSQVACIGWTKADPTVQQIGFQKFLSYQTQIPAGANALWRTPLAETGLVRAIVIPNPVTLSRVRCVINNREVFNVTGGGYNGAAPAVIGSMLSQIQFSEGSSSAADTLADPICIVLELGEPALAGSSWIEWTTIAGFPASTEVAILSTEML